MIYETCNKQFIILLIMGIVLSSTRVKSEIKVHEDQNIIETAEPVLIENSIKQPKDKKIKGIHSDEPHLQTKPKKKSPFSCFSCFKRPVEENRNEVYRKLNEPELIPEKEATSVENPDPKVENSERIPDEACSISLKKQPAFEDPIKNFKVTTYNSKTYNKERTVVYTTAKHSTLDSAQEQNIQNPKNEVVCKEQEVKEMETMTVNSQECQIPLVTNMEDKSSENDEISEAELKNLEDWRDRQRKAREQFYNK